MRARKFLVHCLVLPGDFLLDFGGRKVVFCRPDYEYGDAGIYFGFLSQPAPEREFSGGETGFGNHLLEIRFCLVPRQIVEYEAHHVFLLGRKRLLQSRCYKVWEFPVP